jgi:hypothetical protein
MPIHDTVMPNAGLTGYVYVTTPGWILDADISDRAVRLFGVLSRYVEAGETTWPSRATLSAQLRCAITSVDRALRELVTIGAIDIQHRWRDDGSPTTSLFRVWPATLSARGDLS